MFTKGGWWIWRVHATLLASYMSKSTHIRQSWANRWQNIVSICCQCRCLSARVTNLLELKEGRCSKGDKELSLIAKLFCSAQLICAAPFHILFWVCCFKANTKIEKIIWSKIIYCRKHHAQNCGKQTRSDQLHFKGGGDSKFIANSFYHFLSSDAF